LKIARLEVISKVELEKLKNDQMLRLNELESQLKTKEAAMSDQQKRYKEDLEQKDRTVAELNSQLQQQTKQTNQPVVQQKIPETKVKNNQTQTISDSSVNAEANTLNIEPTEGEGDREGFTIKILKLEKAEDGNLKVHILHTSLRDGYTIALFQPQTNTYLTDEEGNQYNMIDKDFISAVVKQENRLGRTNFPKDIGKKYILTFSSLKRLPKFLNFTAVYYGSTDHGCCFLYQAAIKNIKIK
jgi:hypothetical protein